MQTKTVIQIILPIYKRLEVTRLCLRGIQRLQQDPRYIIRCLLVWSRQEDKQNLGWFFDNHLNTCVGLPNKPLGAKMNKAIDFAFNHMNHWDYFMQLGSDDLLATDYLDKIERKMQKGTLFFGPDKLLIVDGHIKRCKFMQAITNIGAGRMIHRGLLDPMREKGEYFDNGISKGLDNSLTRRIYEVNGLNEDTFQQIIPSDTPVVCDIKSSINIHSYDAVPGEPVEWSRFDSLFPELKKIVYEG
jgi:hypothetical protein